MDSMLSFSIPPPFDTATVTAPFAVSLPSFYDETTRTREDGGFKRLDEYND